MVRKTGSKWTKKGLRYTILPLLQRFCDSDTIKNVIPYFPAYLKGQKV